MEDPMERAMDAIRAVNEKHIAFQSAVLLALDVYALSTEATRAKAIQMIQEALERLDR